MSVYNFSSVGTGNGILTRVAGWTPAITQLRYRRRPNLKEPTKFYTKQRLIELCRPVYPKLDVCENILKPKKPSEEESIKDNKYGLFLARCMRERFDKHPMIAIFHSNSFSGHDYLNMRGMLYDNKFDMLIHHNRDGRDVAVEALTNTKYEPALPLFVSRTSVGYCREPDVAKLLHCLKKMPQFILMGLILENRLLHRDDVEKIAKLRDITSVRAELCHTLQLSTTQLSQTLTANQAALSSSLSSLCNEQQTSSDEKEKGSS